MTFCGQTWKCAADHFPGMANKSILLINN